MIYTLELYLKWNVEVSISVSRLAKQLTLLYSTRKKKSSIFLRFLMTKSHVLKSMVSVDSMIQNMVETQNNVVSFP